MLMEARVGEQHAEAEPQLAEEMAAESAVIFDTNLKFDLDRNASDVCLREQRYQIKENDHRRSVKYTYMLRLDLLTSKKPNFQSADGDFWAGRQLKLPLGTDTNDDGETDEADYPPAVDLVMITLEERNSKAKFSDIDASQVIQIPFKIIASFPREQTLLSEIKNREDAQTEQKKRVEGFRADFLAKLTSLAEEFANRHDKKLQAFTVPSVQNREDAVKHYQKEIKEKTKPGLKVLEDQMNTKIQEFETRIKDYKAVHKSIKSRGIKRRKMFDQARSDDHFLEQINLFNKQFRELNAAVAAKRLSDRTHLEFFELKLTIFQKETPAQYLEAFLTLACKQT